MKVVMLTPFPYLKQEEYGGGIVQVSLRLSETLSKIQGVELYVVSKSDHISSIEYYNDRPYHRIYFPRKFPGYDWFLLKHGMTSSIKKIIKDIKPDIIHAQGNPDYILSTLRIKDIPYIVTIHGIYANELKVWKARATLKDKIESIFLRNAEEYNFRNINNLISITNEISRIISKKNSHVNIFPIDNPIDDNFFSIKNENVEPVVLFVGVIVKRKGLHFLIEAFSKIVHKIPSAKLRIAGMWDWDRAYVEELIKKYKYLINSGHIIFLGPISQEQLYEEIALCRLLSLPSYAESAPMVIAQAMAAGKPVVASNVGGIPTMVRDGFSGILAEVGDVNAIQCAIEKLLLDNNLSKQMGQNGKQEAWVRYSSIKVALKTVDAYKSILLPNK